MSEHDRASQRLRSKFEEVLGEPEATMLMDRLATREDIRVIVREEIRGVRDDLRSEIHGLHGELRAEIHRTARQNLLAMVTAMAVFNAGLFAAISMAGT